MNKTVKIDHDTMLIHKEHVFRPRAPHSISSSAILGLCVIAISLGGFGVWAATAPLSSAIVTTGIFVASGQNKIVQHLEGGIIRDILVKEGDMVNKNQSLLRMDKTAAKVRLRRLILQQCFLQAKAARLLAERFGKTHVSFPRTLRKMEPKREVTRIIAGQVAEFAARRKDRKNRIAAVSNRIKTVETQIKGITTQKTAVSRQAALIGEELKVVEMLFRKKLTRKNKVLALKRANIKLMEQDGSLDAQLARAREQMEILAHKKSLIQYRARLEAVEKSRKLEMNLSDIEQQIKSSKDVLGRLDVLSPVKGIVVKLHQHTPGGVLTPGQKILELLPVEEELVIEVYVRPTDIASVQKGLPTIIRLTAMNQRVTPTVSGHVIYVSADAIRGPKNGEVVYVARIKLDKSAPGKLHDFQPAPGMPVETHIRTGEQTLLEYLFKPFQDSMKRAFRES